MNNSCIARSMSCVAPQYALQLQAKLVNRKNKGKQDVNRNFKQQDQELTASANQDEDVCIKVRFRSYMLECLEHW